MAEGAPRINYHISQIAMKKFKLVVALLIPIAFGATVFVLREQNHALVRNFTQKNNELNQELSLTKTELKQVKTRLEVAENKLGFLNNHKAMVEVTAYTKSSSTSRFADGRSVLRAYAVPEHVLPEDHVVYVALSPTAQARLHAHMHDYLVLAHKGSSKRTIARFVDIMPAEKRPVVDVFFADSRQAFLWGRKRDYYAVNISSNDSPFKGVL